MKQLLYIIIILLVSAIFYSCRTTRYIPVETKVHDTTYINKMQVDSIFDSTFVYMNGDTVLKYKYIYKYKMLRDTLYVSKTDSIQIPYQVEREFTWWQNVKMQSGGLAILIIIAGIVFILIKKILHL